MPPSKPYAKTKKHSARTKPQRFHSKVQKLNQLQEVADKFLRNT